MNDKGCYNIRAEKLFHRSIIIIVFLDICILFTHLYKLQVYGLISGCTVVVILQIYKMLSRKLILKHALITGICTFIHVSTSEFKIIHIRYYSIVTLKLLTFYVPLCASHSPSKP